MWKQHIAFAASLLLILSVLVLSFPRFKWDVKSFQPDFSISPTKGYISPGMDVPFVVSFHPSKLSPAIRYEGLQCFIQDSEPLCLTLAGCCMETPVVKEVTAAVLGLGPSYPTTPFPGYRLEALYLLLVFLLLHPA